MNLALLTILKLPVSRGEIVMKATELRNYNRALQAVSDYFDGDMEAAELWMQRPTGSLGGHKPIEMLSTEQEFHAVLSAINRLEDGRM